jgi:hypothetical protein
MNDCAVVRNTGWKIVGAEHKHLVNGMRIPGLKYSGKKPEEKVPECKSGHADD